MSDLNVVPVAPRAPSRLPWLLFTLALVAAIGAGVFGFMQWQGKKSAATALDDALQRAKDAEDAKAALQLDLSQRETKIGELSAKSDELQQNLDSTEAELAKLKAESDSLQDKLQAEIKKGEIRVEQNGDRITVDL